MKLITLNETTAIPSIKYRQNKVNLLLANIISKVILSGDSRLKKPLKNGDIAILDIFDAIKAQKCLRVLNYSPDKTNKHLKAISLGPSYLEQQISKTIDKAVEIGSLPQSHISYLRTEIGLDIPLKESKEIHDLPDAKITIPLPTLRQSEKFSCGATVIQMIAAYYGIDIRESDLIDKLGIKPNSGVKLSKLSKIANDLDFHTKRILVDYQQIINCINNKIPLVLAIEKADKSYYHFVVPTGYYNNGIIFGDPAKYVDSYLDADEFDNRAYKTKNGKFLALSVVSNKKPNFNSREVEKL
jgi:predicted double-glycine peptidase